MRLILLTIFSLAQAEANGEGLSLECKGQITNQTIYKDGRVKQDRDTSNLFVTVDDNQSAVRIDGDWGCLDPKLCSQDIPARIDEGRMVFSVKGKFIGHDPFTASASINRRTGLMKSTAVTYGDDDSTWVTFGREGAFECQKVTGRKF